MIDLFMPIRVFLKFDNVCTDNNVFRMHYTITVIMLLVFTVLVTSKQFFGDPIHCMSDSEKDNDKDAINTYCWIYGIYTRKSDFVGFESKRNVYPGVGPDSSENSQSKINHSYYQWVFIVLLVQAVMFYTPRYMWKIWEGGRLKALAADLSNPLVSKDWSEFRRGQLVSYLSYTNIHTHNMYALRYAFCEILNLANVVGQIFLLDVFLGGAFRSYGATVAAITHIPLLPSDLKNYTAVNPLEQILPKLAKCSLKNYGPTGTIQIKDRLCVLPLNIINEKIYIILWFWLMALAFASTLAVVFRVLVLTLRPLRCLMITGQLKYVKRSLVSRIVKRFSYGDWFILYMLGKNMNPIIYKDLIIELSKELEQRTIMI